MTLTLILIIVTCAVSLLAFSNDRLLEELLLWPARMNSPVQYYRFLTAGFVHADYAHLAFNMISLYFFGDAIERQVGQGSLLFLYLLGIIVSCIPSYFKKRGQPGYRSLGASGGVAAVIFASIYLQPWNQICMFFAICIPSILFAVVYLSYTAYLARKGYGIVNHDAHLWGSVFGLVFMLVIDQSHGRYFLEELMHPRW